ncbi:MAG: hypothetical protein ACLRMN_10135 [Mediterraneibacter gnavus]
MYRTWSECQKQVTAIRGGLLKGW